MGLVFMKMSPYVVGKEFPELISTHRPFMSIRHITSADCIFEFQGGKTVYFKDRYAENYQYSEDERLIIKLKAVHM